MIVWLQTDFRLSLCVLYSMMVLGGRCNTRFNVSRILVVVAWSDAVRFHKARMSSCDSNIIFIIIIVIMVVVVVVVM